MDHRNVHKPSKGGKEEPASRLMLCLGIVSALLAASIIIIIRFSVVLYRQHVNLSEMMIKMQILESQSELLHRDRDDLSWTLGVILTFDRFPVRDFCRDGKCQPCRRDWILFQQRCYLFYKDGWFTWEEGRELCQNYHADLVVIDNLQEQEFISNQTEYYFDKYHGYWLGLYESGDSWIWVNGRHDTFGFWMQEPFSFPGKHALLLPHGNRTKSWAKADAAFKNKFICEGQVLKRSN